MTGIQKWAFALYAGLCVFLISRPSPDKISRRAEELDTRFATEEIAAVKPALASALGLSEQSLDLFADDPQFKPSALVFKKLLERCESENCDENPAEALVKAGVSVHDAVDFFDTVEKKVAATLERTNHNRTAISAKGPKPPRDLHGRLSVRSTPD